MEWVPSSVKGRKFLSLHWFGLEWQVKFGRPNNLVDFLKRIYITFPLSKQFCFEVHVSEEKKTQSVPVKLFETSGGEGIKF